MKGFNDVDCPACNGLGDQENRKLRDRIRGTRTGHNTRCRRCRGAGIL